MSLMVVVVVLVLGVTYGQGQAPAQVEQAKEFRGRLPAYFSSVVDDRQRQQIYAIQRHYFGQIENLKAQLEALTEKRDGEVYAVLSLQQRAEVECLAETAKAKRDAKKGKGKAAAR